MKYVWEVTVQKPDSDDSLTLYGQAANINIAISKAKKKAKEHLGMKSESDDLTVLTTKRLYEIQF